MECPILPETPAFPLEGLLQAADQVLADIVLIVGNEATTGSDSRHEEPARTALPAPVPRRTASRIRLRMSISLPRSSG